ncbi:MAG: ATP-binding cassette domain-containing protein, partial [Peptostreptococcaceae bacterium]|nr:ATP-binding cassette domain-containing protein [Peptostreptococcaceae bacterium]
MIRISNVSKVYKIRERSDKGLFSNLFKGNYKHVEAVKNIDLCIGEGERVGLIGSNGAGKTTTLKMLAGLIHPTEGSIDINGFEPKKLQNEYLMEIGLVMGNKSQLWWDISSYDSFLLEGYIYGLHKDEIERRIEELADLLDVKPLLKTPVRKLSLGERMKMELILVLLHQPSILFLDEPTLGLDIISQKKLREFINRYNSERRSTMIITSHNMRDVEELCDRVIVIDRGCIIYDGLIEDLKAYKGESDFEEIISKLLGGSSE